jgi:glycosyltransferase involved in cell wall biosynthesis
MGTLRGAGSARLGQRLLRGLCATRPPAVRHLCVWTPPDWADLPARGLDARRVMRPGALGKLWGENLSLRWGLRSADALVSFGDTSLIGCPLPHVLLVQQAFLVSDLGALPFALPLRWRLKMEAMAAYLRLGAPSVSAFVVQSPWMGEALCGRWPSIEGARVHVIPSPMGQVSAQAQGRPPAPEGRGGPRLVCVTGPGPHKHLMMLPALLHELRDVGARLDVTLWPRQAPEVAEAAARLGVGERLRWVGRVTHGEALGMLASVDVCVQASLLESFSYPLHEALAVGGVVVAPDLPYARDAAGDAACYAAPPTSARAFAQAVRAALAPEVAGSLRARARARAVQMGLRAEAVGARYWSLLSAVW